MGHGALTPLQRVAEHPLIDVPARVRCTQLFQILAATPEGERIVSAARWAQLTAFLLRSHAVPLQEAGALAVAIHSMRHKKVRVWVCLFAWDTGDGMRSAHECWWCCCARCCKACRRLSLARTTWRPWPEQTIAVPES